MSGATDPINPRNPFFDSFGPSLAKHQIIKKEIEILSIFTVFRFKGNRVGHLAGAPEVKVFVLFSDKSYLRTSHLNHLRTSRRPAALCFQGASDTASGTLVLRCWWAPLKRKIGRSWKMKMN